MSTIRIDHIHKTLGSGPKATHALKGSSLVVKTGEFIAISGKSGSGKTTLLNAMAGLLPVDKGTIEIDGFHVETSSEKDLLKLRRETVGIVHQSDLIIPELTAAENIEFTLSAAGYSDADARQETSHLLAQVGLDGLGTRYPNELSRGQCQRVGIARALSGRRSILLADEPSAALDQENSRSIFALFKALAAQNTTVIVASHDPLVLNYCSRSLTLVDGMLNESEAKEAPPLV